LQVFKLQSSDGYAFVNYSNTADYEISWTLNDRKPGDNWRIPNVTTVYENDEDRRFANYKQSDSLGMGQCIFSKKAVDILGKALEPHGEFLQLNNANGPECYLFLANKIDALDLDRSDVTYFPSVKTRIMAIRKHAFLEGAIGSRLAFRLNNGPMVNFFTKPIVDLTLQSDLAGFSFKLLWESP
jgi:hypothetical protein